VEEIGRRIQEARKAAGLTQEGLARRADVSLNGLAQLEQGGRKDPHVSTVQKLAVALGLPPEHFLRRTVDELTSKAPRKETAPTQQTVREKLEILRSEGALSIYINVEGGEELGIPPFEVPSTKMLDESLVETVAQKLVEAGVGIAPGDRVEVEFTIPLGDETVTGRAEAEYEKLAVALAA